MILVAENKGWKIYFNCTKQEYSVYRDDKFIIGGKHRYREVSSYVA